VPDCKVRRAAAPKRFILRGTRGFGFREDRPRVNPFSLPRKENGMAGKFELKKSKDGQFMFNLKASNGQVILTSELYKTKASAENGIERYL
jgi:uncharacterized protein YegP (UPF0339 family)